MTTKYWYHLGNVSDKRVKLCPLVSSADKLLQTVWTQIRPDKSSGLIWIQTFWHFAGIPVRIFRKKLLEKKNSRRPKSMQNYPVGKAWSFGFQINTKYLSYSSCLVFFVTGALIICMLGLFMIFVVCIFFQNQLFQKFLSGIPSECQTGWSQVRPDIVSGLIWFQSVCKSYQQTTSVDKELS